MATRAAPTDLTVLIRRERHGEGVDGPRDPPLELAQGRAIHPGQLRRIPEGLLSPSSSATNAAPSREPSARAPGASSWRARGRSSSTRSATCRWRCRPRSCAFSGRQFERVGGTRSIGAGRARIAATHQDLEAMAAEGRFRSDLFYRLQGVRLVMPAAARAHRRPAAPRDHLLDRSAQRLWAAARHRVHRGAPLPLYLPVAGQHPRAPTCARGRHGPLDGVICPASCRRPFSAAPRARRRARRRPP